MPRHLNGAPQDQYIENLRKRVEAHERVAREQTSLIRKLLAEVCGLRERLDQATEADALLRRAGLAGGPPVKPVRPRRDRHGLHVVPVVAVLAGAAAALLARSLRMSLPAGVLAAALIAGGGMRLAPVITPPGHGGHDRPVPAVRIQRGEASGVMPKRAVPERNPRNRRRHPGPGAAAPPSPAAGDAVRQVPGGVTGSPVSQAAGRQRVRSALRRVLQGVDLACDRMLRGVICTPAGSKPGPRPGAGSTTTW